MKISNNLKSICLAVGVLFIASGAMAQENITTSLKTSGDWSILAGSYKGNSRLGLSYTTAPWWTHNLENSRINLNMEFEVAKWSAGSQYKDYENNTNMWQVTINPMFNWEFQNNVFLQAGIGLSSFSTNNFADRRFGSKLNFSDNLGIGYRFTPNTAVSYRISHYSNASLKKPNPGITMQQIILTHKF